VSLRLEQDREQLASITQVYHDQAQPVQGLLVESRKEQQDIQKTHEAKLRDLDAMAAAHAHKLDDSTKYLEPSGFTEHDGVKAPFAPRKLYQGLKGGDALAKELDVLAQACQLKDSRSLYSAGAATALNVVSKSPSGHHALAMELHSLSMPTPRAQVTPRGPSPPLWSARSGELGRAGRALLDNPLPGATACAK
jgi:hypothetical protein